MMKWHEIEDKKYSELYADGYPIGDPMGLVKKFNYSSDKAVCDLGCGRASSSNFFKNYVGVDVSTYIINENKKNRTGEFYRASLHDLSVIYNKEFDLSICADVMEHIPPEEVNGVLSEISKLKSKKFAFSISTRPSVFLDKEGNNLHLTVWSNNKWIEELSSYFKVIRQIDKPTLLSVELESKQL